MTKVFPEDLKTKITPTSEVVDKITLRISHRNDDLRTKLQRDMRKWEATLAEDKQDKAKIIALKKTLLLLGSSGMEITGGVEKETISASGNKLPIAEYLSGHMGRVYLGLPKKGAAETLKWISGEDKVIKPRFAATHGATVVVSSGGKKEVKEEKLKFLKAAFSGIKSILSSTSTPRIHNGMDVAMGGKGNILESAKSENPKVGKIKDDGTCGHVYFNANSGKNGDSLGIGLEGTAPGKTGYLGSHSIVGSADEFSALEGEKFAVKFNKKALASYLENKEMKNPKGPDCEKVKEAVEKLKKHLAYKKSFLEKFGFSRKGEALLSKEDLAETCKNAGIAFVGGGKQMLTRFGKQCVEAGIKPQDNYGGAKMMVEEKTLKEIMAIKDSEIPDEIIYFKPQNSPQCFVAQKPIYEGIESKPVLRDNPQFSHETSVAIGTFYNSANSRSSSDDGAKIIRETIGLIDKDKLDILEIDINSFDVLKDFEKLNSKLTSFGHEDLKNLLGITVEKDDLMASLKKMKIVANAIAKAKEGEFSTEKEYLKLENDVFKTDRTASLPSPERVVDEKAFDPLQNPNAFDREEEASKENPKESQAATLPFKWRSKVRAHPASDKVIKSDLHSL